MNLTQLREQIKLVVEHLSNVTLTRHTNINPPYYDVVGTRSYKSAFRALSNVGIFKDAIGLLNNSAILDESGDTIRLNNENGIAIQSTLSAATNQLNTFIDILNEVLPELPEETIFIKLPEIADLDALEKSIHEFNIVFSRLILRKEIGGQIIFEGVEPGSNYIKVCLKTWLAVQIVGSVFWSGAVIAKKIEENETQIENARSLKIKNDVLENMAHAQKTLLDAQVNLEVQAFYRKYYEKKEIDHELLMDIEFSINTMAEQIRKGAELSPLLSAPENVSNLFPDIKMLPAITSKIGNLQNGTGSMGEK